MKKKRRGRPETARWSSTSANYRCPWCAQTVDTYPDLGASESQSYVEDCALCCHPNLIEAVLDGASGEWSITASRE
jgi:hypothetical protein